MIVQLVYVLHSNLKIALNTLPQNRSLEKYPAAAISKPPVTSNKQLRSNTRQQPVRAGGSHTN